MSTKPNLTLQPNQPLNLEPWLQQIFTRYPEAQNPLIRQAGVLAQLTGSDCATTTGQSCVQQGLYMAEILSTLSVDQETLAAAILYHTIRHGDLVIEDIAEQLNPAVAKLI